MPCAEADATSNMELWQFGVLRIQVVGPCSHTGAWACAVCWHWPFLHGTGPGCKGRGFCSIRCRRASAAEDSGLEVFGMLPEFFSLRLWNRFLVGV